MPTVPFSSLDSSSVSTVALLSAPAVTERAITEFRGAEASKSGVDTSSCSSVNSSSVNEAKSYRTSTTTARCRTCVGPAVPASSTTSPTSLVGLLIFATASVPEPFAITHPVFEKIIRQHLLHYVQLQTSISNLLISVIARWTFPCALNILPKCYRD